MEERQKLEDGFWNSRPKQRHLNYYRLAILLSSFRLDVNLEGIRIVRRVISDGRVGLVRDRKRSPTILPVLFW